jgi:hypothetical protein
MDGLWQIGLYVGCREDGDQPEEPLVNGLGPCCCRQAETRGVEELDGIALDLICIGAVGLG